LRGKGIVFLSARRGSPRSTINRFMSSTSATACA
jgi:hypothetical protein